jgi:hypothetical protein
VDEQAIHGLGRLPFIAAPIYRGVVFMLTTHDGGNHPQSFHF